MRKQLIFLFLVFITAFYACEKNEIENTDDKQNQEEEQSENEEENTEDSTSTVSICNGYASLCDLAYDEISFAATHNAHAVQGEFSDLAANQDLDVTAQLDLGIRVLNIKSYWTNHSNCGTTEGHYLYHGSEGFGCVPLSGFLADVKNWMDSNPDEVVTFTIEPGASVAQLDQSFTDAGLKPWMYQHTSGEEWPTLRVLLENEKRLVVFTNKGSDNGNYEGFHSYWDYTFDTDYDNQSRTDFSCDKDRGNSSGDFFLLNHFLTKLTPQFDSASTINASSFLLERAQACAAEHGQNPNFVMVDFAGQGDVVEVVNTLNGVN